jgi:hypothetical protein
LLELAYITSSFLSPPVHVPNDSTLSYDYQVNDQGKLDTHIGMMIYYCL